MKIFNAFFITFSLLFLSACSTSLIPLRSHIPDHIEYQQQSYRLKAQQDLGTMARLVYFAGEENLQNWRTALELLLDSNEGKQSLAQRLALRQRVYRNTGVQNVNLYIENDSLLGVIIYSPTEKYRNWQMDILQGKNVQGCGFMQYQYSRKFPESEQLTRLTEQIAVQELSILKKHKWQWSCK